MDSLSFPGLTDLGYEHDPPLVMLWNGLLTDSLRAGHERLRVSPPASGERNFPIRAYKDGAWTEFFWIPGKMYDAFMRRLKVMAELTLVRSVPHDEGAIKVGRAGKASLLIRVSLRRDASGREEAILELPIERLDLQDRAT